MSEVGILKFFKTDESGDVETQETYNKEYIDGKVDEILQFVDEKIATLSPKT
jgi:hypothetical protein